MPNEIPTPSLSLIPPQELPAGAEEFTRTLHRMMDGRTKDEGEVVREFEGMEGMFDLIAAGLYSMASMLVGEGEASISLVETAVTNADVSACANPEEARASSRGALAAAALEMISSRDASSLAAPEDWEPAVTCIEDDDLDAAGQAREDLQRLLAGPSRDQVRAWLESLPIAMRTIYILRAVAGFTSVETSELLVAHAGPNAAGWTPDAVREQFRQGLCSIASQLIHASSAR